MDEKTMYEAIIAHKNARIAELETALERLVSAARDVDTGYMDQAIEQADNALVGQQQQGEPASRREQGKHELYCKMLDPEEPEVICTCGLAQPARQVGKAEPVDIQCEDAELQNLLNLTGDMVTGRANQDGAMYWAELLDSVAARLLAPSAVAVVMPEPLTRSDNSMGEYGAAMIRGYEACRRQVARLNRVTVSLALLDGLMSTIEHVVHDDRVPNDVSQECAAVLLKARAILEAGKS